ncbi:mt-a70 family protein [Thraustotheca clavata]|uniref:Mt-a70 family protein n=1 Tax=Thraustotheca clavata TaxID=74557 RepID=A0A1W0A2U4_9STRA|nr:mt-a70 family protein [Thraustotheca clavata]
MDLMEMEMQFDCIVVDPPWREMNGNTWWSVDELAELNINGIGAFPSVLFLWCGSGGTYDGKHSHFDEACTLLEKWNYRLCEVITWAKTMESAGDKSIHGLIRRTKEQCLVGLRDYMWKETSANFIHPNIDTDVIIAPAMNGKPDAFFELVERFCLGRRRLSIFGSTPPNGWITLGPNVPFEEHFDLDKYLAGLRQTALNPNTPFSIGTSPVIEQLRPKPPVRLKKSEKNKQ